MTVSTGVYAARPAGSEGDLYLPTDGFCQYYRDAAEWIAHGPCYPWTIPDDSDFAWVNQGGATVDDTYGPICLTAPALAAHSWRIRKKAAPSTPYIITAAFCGFSFDAASPFLGILWRQSSDGKLITFSQYCDTNTYYLMKWTDEVTYSANYAAMNHTMTPSFFWFRLEDDGVNRIVYWSIDGQHWVQIHSVGRTDFLTADEIGFGVSSSNATYGSFLTLLHWEET